MGRKSHRRSGSFFYLLSLLPQKFVVSDIWLEVCICCGRNEIKGEIAQFDGRAPGLAVVLVGERTDSATYVRMKLKACEAAGIKSVKITLPEDVSQDELLSRVHTLNEDESMDGILVQVCVSLNI